MEDSTTDASVQDTGADNTAQPEEQHAEADNTPQSESNDQNNSSEQQEEPGSSQEEQSDNSRTEDVKEATEEWMKSKGLDPNDPEAFRKAANMAFNSEKMMSKSQARSSELEKSLASQGFEQVSDNPLVQEAIERTANLELTMTVENWKRDNNITAEQDKAIGDYLKANPNKAQLLKNGYIDLNDVRSMSGVGTPNTEEIKNNASRDTLEKLANQQRASAPSGNATTSAPPTALTKDNAESWWANLGTEGRKNPENRKKLDRVLGS